MRDGNFALLPGFTLLWRGGIRVKPIKRDLCGINPIGSPGEQVFCVSVTRARLQPASVPMCVVECRYISTEIDKTLLPVVRTTVVRPWRWYFGTADRECVPLLLANVHHHHMLCCVRTVMSAARAFVRVSTLNNLPTRCVSDIASLCSTIAKHIILFRRNYQDDHYICSRRSVIS